MRNVTVARRYARALYETAVQTKDVDSVLQGYSNLAHAYAISMELKRLLLNPLVKLELKHKLALSVTSNQLVLRFVGLLAKRKRLDLIPVIHELIVDMVDQSTGVHRALIKTAIPLSEAQKRNVESDLAHRLGGKIVGQFDVAKDLIGGVWVKMGDKVLDASIKGRFESFRHALIHSTN